MRILLASILLLGAPPCLAADLPLKPYAYHENFETAAPPVALWASRGSPPIVNFLGLSEEQPFGGQRCLKLDVTFGDSAYYYFGVPVRVPMAGKLTISARFRLGAGNQVTAGFGVNSAYPPTSHTGCGAIESYRGQTDWNLVQGDLVDIGRSGAEGVIARETYGVSGAMTAPMLDRWSIFLYGSRGQRAVVYVDDIRIEGEVPDEAAYLAQATAAFDAAQAKFRGEVVDWRKQLDERKAVVTRSEAYAADAPQLVAAVKAAYVRADTLLSGIEKAKYANRADVQELQQTLAALEHAPATLQLVSQAKAAGRKFVVYPCDTPTTLSRKGGVEGGFTASSGARLSAAACTGEYESVSAFVYAFQDLASVRVTSTDLKGAAGTIPATAVDVRIVKPWFQGASNNIGYTPDKWLIPELLLKDDGLVRVDVGRETNYLRSTRADGTTEYLICSDRDSSNLADVRPMDAATLQPVDISAGESREYWVTIHVPDKAKPGAYEGALRFACSGGQFVLPLRLAVRPFVLQPSRLTYSIYYRARLAPEGRPHIDSELRSEEQYRAEMADLLAHGVLYPTNYQGWDEQKLTRILQIRREVGLPAGRFYNLGYGVGPRKPAEIPALQQAIKQWLAFLKPWGYDEVYFYGTDEATGEALLAQKATWAATQAAGGKTFVACYKKTFEAMGKLLNTAVLAGPPDPEEAKKYHSVGSEAFCYANPQVGVEDPLVYRRNFGLVLWRAGFDGAMDYAYQHGFGHVWNDFDDMHYRDHNFTYPTLNGVVGTIQWEGFREGVDDVRYVTTLEQAIAEAAPAKKRLAAEAQEWLDELHPARADLDAMRAQMAGWIIKLR